MVNAVPLLLSGTSGALGFSEALRDLARLRCARHAEMPRYKKYAGMMKISTRSSMAAHIALPSCDPKKKMAYSSPPNSASTSNIFSTTQHLWAIGGAANFTARAQPLLAPAQQAGQVRVPQRA